MAVYREMLLILDNLQVDIHIMTKPPVGDWICFGTETTDSGGRVMYTIPKEKQLPQGMYPVKMVVRWDSFFSLRFHSNWP